MNESIQTFDLLVIGGRINGVGIAMRQAAACGWCVVNATGLAG